MAHRRKTWKEKMDNGRVPEVETLKAPFAGAPAGALMLVSTPKEVDTAIRAIPRGTSVTVAELRRSLARSHGAATSCPTSTSIFVRICAECALEDLASGARLEEVAPFWRVVDAKSPIAGRLSCGVEKVRELRTSEGLEP
ncbi:MAG: MGMT family protein [Armatimonadetes bacterium]|nr:MGMT family protein [Armatimonadota bacterium]